jgi:hypothetical protein
MGSLLISKAQFSMKPTGAIFHTDLIQFLGGGVQFVNSVSLHDLFIVNYNLTFKLTLDVRAD